MGAVARMDAGLPICDVDGMPERSRKRPRDASRLAKLVVDIATGEIEEASEFEGKNPAAVLLGRRGGQKGGKARAAKLSKRRRLQIAKKAAQARWAAKAPKT